ncbi:MAG: nitrous oxide reductase family maturation protein NosD [Nitrososphaerota archaeon]
MGASLQRRFVALAGILAAILCALSLEGGVASAHGSQVLCVNPHGQGCYQSIQDAVNHASSGARINVAAGVYTEQVTITKSLTLHGAGKHSIINAIGQSHGILVDGLGARGTVISGFTVENATLEGILIQNTKHVVVRDNVVSHNDRGRQPNGTCPGALPFDQDDCGEAVHLLGVAWSTVAHNVVENNVGGILLTDETGPTHDNLITRNVVRDNKLDCGITLPSHPSGFDANGVPLPGNGVYHNTVSYNLSTGNGGAGVGIFTPTPGTKAYDNLVLGNVLTHNGLPGVALHSHAFGQNLNGNRIIGNFVSGNAADGDAGTSGPTGIAIFSDANGNAAPITGMTIKYNTVTGEAIDIWIGTTAMDLALHDNNLFGSGAIGVENAGSGVVDATLNYWGCPGGPGAPGCSTTLGNVSFTPWLSHRV